MVQIMNEKIYKEYHYKWDKKYKQASNRKVTNSYNSDTDTLKLLLKNRRSRHHWIWKDAHRRQTVKW